jgi:guanylate kinase
LNEHGRQLPPEPFGEISAGMNHRSHVLIVIAGPSGCGKTTIAHALMERHPETLFSVSATTRPKRPSEVHGKDYFFITRDDFEKKIERNELAEWEQIYGDYYGSLISEIERAAAAGVPMMFDVDVKGALSIKKKYPERTILIFIKPPSMECLTHRLKSRKTETPETFARRMNRAAMELELANEFDHVIVNDDLAIAIDAADAIAFPKK